MTAFHSLILGIIEGFTEFLPISSTAHLILAAHVLGLDQGSFVKTFEIAIQSGAIFAVIAVYWRKFLDIEISKKVLAAFVPTAVIGILFYKVAKEYLLGNVTVVLWALALGGLFLIVFEKYWRLDESGRISDIRLMSYKQAILIGLAQAVAIIPGVSRSAATILGGIYVGMNRQSVVEFSFLLAVPTILAATLLDLVKNFGMFSAGDAGSLAIGFVASFVTAIFGIRFLLAIVRDKTFIGFGFYRILLVAVFIVFFL